MKYSLRKNRNNPSVLKGIILSAAGNLITVFTGTALITALISAGTIDESVIPGFAWAVLFLSALIGSIAACSGAKENGIIAAASGAAVFYLLLICMNIMLFDGVFPGIGWGSIIVILGYAAGVLIRYIPLSGRQKVKFKYFHR